MLLIVCIIDIDSEAAIWVVPAPRLPSQYYHYSAKIIQSVCTASFMLQVGRVGKKGFGCWYIEGSYESVQVLVSSLHDQ
jgi:hypothetical protein